MPWRGTRDPYRIWLSEVMLQQTRVAAVVGYYRRFLRRFPMIHALAGASENEVLKHWAGLGYYTRARNLHCAAKQIVAQHAGRFPHELDAALALPGVGRYTAAAVLSIAYDQPYAVLDGNVARVLARLYAIRGDLHRPPRWRELQSLAHRLLPSDKAVAVHSRATQSRPGVRRLAAALPREACFAHSPQHPLLNAKAKSLDFSSGNWNQAMMELGATVCTPRAPRCDACPVSRWCKARRLGLVDELPAARRKREPVRMAVAAAVLLDPRGRTLLIKPERSATNGLFSHMWQFPAVEGACRVRARLSELMQEAKGKRSTQRTQRSTEGTEAASQFVALKPARHSVTFREITLRPFLLHVQTLPRINGTRTPRLDKLESLPVSNATRKIAQRALDFLATGSDGAARNVGADLQIGPRTGLNTRPYTYDAESPS